MSTFDQASLVMIPSGYKTSKVYSIKPTDGSGDLTFSRSNDTATRVNSAGLIEKVRTNVALYSEQFDNAYWGKSNVTVTANTTVNPVNGATTADTLTRTGGVSGFLNKQIAQTGIVTFSIFAKAGTTNEVRLNIFDGSTDRGATYNLTTGAISSVYGSPLFTTAQSFGNGWYRISISVNSASYTDCQVQIDSVNSVIIFGAQLETGDIATDYIATTTAAVSVGPVANVPRLDYLNSSCPRLLLEPQRTNFLQYSEQLNNTVVWALDGNGAGQSVTANYAVSPDGYTNADRVQLNRTGGSYSRLRQDYVNATTGTGSIYLKTNNSTTVKIWMRVDGGTSTKITITPNWQRFTLSAATIAGLELFIDSSDAEIPTSVDLSAWGAQLEAGAYATSYIPTLGAAVTRGADLASKTGISSLIGQTEGTIYGEFTTGGLPAVDQYFFNLSDGTTSNIIYIGFYATILVARVIDAGTLNVNINVPLQPNTTYKIAFAYKANDCKVYINGVDSGTDTSATIPMTSRFGMNEFSEVANYKVSQALLFKTRLTNAQLAELTTI